MEEKTTLIASLALVISLNSEKIKDSVLFLTEPTADFIHKYNWLAKITLTELFSNRQGILMEPNSKFDCAKENSTKKP